MKYIVTGGSGFIGSHLCLKLLERGDTVFNVDLKPPFWEESLIPRIEEYRKAMKYNWVCMDMADPQIEQLMYQTYGVFHLGGVLGTAETMCSIPETAETNVVKTTKVFDMIRRLKRKSVYITLGNDWENPYTITKTAAARFALMYNREFGTKITVIRGLNVYGARQKWFPVNKYFPRFVVNAIERKKIPVYGDGEQLIDVVYVGDVVQALIKAMETDFGKEQYEQILDAGTGHAISVNETVHRILFNLGLVDKIEIYGAENARKALSKHPELVEYLPMRPGEPIRSKTLGNVAKINEILKFVPTTELEEGIALSVEWYEKNYKELETYAKTFGH